MEHRPYFPLFVDLSEKRVLVVGAGAVANRRVQALLPFARHITVIAPEVHGSLAALEEAGEIVLCRRAYAPEDTDTADFVLAATDDRRLNGEIAARCRAHHIPVNVCDDPQKCDFFFPGIVREDNLVIGVTASGTDHKAAKALTEELRRYMGERAEK